MDAEPLNWSTPLEQIDGDEFVVRAVSAPARLISDEEMLNPFRFEEVRGSHMYRLVGHGVPRSRIFRPLTPPSTLYTTCARLSFQANYLKYTEYSVVKTNKRGTRQERILGIDEQGMHNKQAPESRSFLKVLFSLHISQRRQLRSSIAVVCVCHGL